MWQRSKKEYTDMPNGLENSFAEMFLSQSLHQKFNKKGFAFLSDENESAIVKYSRRLIANQA